MKPRKCYSCRKWIGKGGKNPHCPSPTCDYCATCYAAKWHECKDADQSAS